MLIRAILLGMEQDIKKKKKKKTAVKRCLLCPLPVIVILLIGFKECACHFQIPFSNTFMSNTNREYDTFSTENVHFCFTIHLIDLINRHYWGNSLLPSFPAVVWIKTYTHQKSLATLDGEIVDQDITIKLKCGMYLKCTVYKPNIYTI